MNTSRFYWILNNPHWIFSDFIKCKKKKSFKIPIQYTPVKNLYQLCDILSRMCTKSKSRTIHQNPWIKNNTLKSQSNTSRKIYVRRFEHVYMFELYFSYCLKLILIIHIFVQFQKKKKNQTFVMFIRRSLYGIYHVRLKQ